MHHTYSDTRRHDMAQHSDVYRLGLNALGTVDQQHGALTGLQGARHFIREVHMPLLPIDTQRTTKTQSIDGGKRKLWEDGALLVCR
jgi:hypothetical protein